MMTSNGLIVFGMVVMTASCIAIAHADINISAVSGSGLQVVMNNLASGCPLIRRAGQSGLFIAVWVDGQDCTSPGSSIRSRDAIKTKRSCPPINIIDGSGLNLQITFMKGAQTYEGVDMRNRSGDQISLIYDLGDCELPDINLYNLSQVASSPFRVHEPAVGLIGTNVASLHLLYSTLTPQ